MHNSEKSLIFYEHRWHMVSEMHKNNFNYAMLDINNAIEWITKGPTWKVVHDFDDYNKISAKAIIIIKKWPP